MIQKGFTWFSSHQGLFHLPYGHNTTIFPSTASIDRSPAVNWKRVTQHGVYKCVYVFLCHEMHWHQHASNLVDENLNRSLFRLPGHEKTHKTTETGGEGWGNIYIKSKFKTFAYQSTIHKKEAININHF